MCCFSGLVDDVSQTRIFARADGLNQFLVYGMNYAARQDLAMVLPLPVSLGSQDGDVRFIDLSGYPDFFEDLEAGFPKPKSITRGVTDRSDTRSFSPVLEVVRVGSFEASFVPSIADFARLDPRFRMPEGVWDRLPGYRNFGFAVFKLRQGGGTAHPMAFQFPRRDARLFFPTVHVHDGQAHAEAHFDHALYCQAPSAPAGWQQSLEVAGRFMKTANARGIVDRAQMAYCRELRGTYKNTDVIL